MKNKLFINIYYNYLLKMFKKTNIVVMVVMMSLYDHHSIMAGVYIDHPVLGDTIPKYDRKYTGWFCASETVCSFVDSKHAWAVPYTGWDYGRMYDGYYSTCKGYTDQQM